MQVMQHSSEQSIKKQKTKEDYSRNVKKLKYKLNKISNQIELYQKKIKRLENTSNDQVIAMKISKFCKERKFTPEMLFRFADYKNEKLVTRSQFRTTLITIGLKLTQQQFTRLEYLLDQDIKGDISLLQYSKYLNAFGLKQEFSTDDPFVKDTLKNIDFNKMLDLSKQKNKSGHRILLNYEQFIKYCHKHFPQFSDKELGKIFSKLSHDYVVDLDDLIDYIQNLKDEQDRINRKNNKEKEKQKQQQQAKKDQQIDFMKEQQEQIDINLLKGKIMAVLKDHPEQQQTFHSSEFKRIQRNFNLQKGMMVSIFREMDTKMLGSIGYNEIIVYYVDKETCRPNNEINIKYAFILMGKKMQSRGQKPQTLAEAYTKNPNEITFQEFKKLCLIEFELKEDLAKKLYDVMLSCPGARNKDNNVEAKLFISLMKFNRKGMKNNYRPLIQEKFKPFMYKKYYETICTNGLVMFKLCRSIVQQLSRVEDGNKKWDDPQFGPVNEDLYGFDSIGQQVSNLNIRWLRISQSKSNEFYIPISGQKTKIYQTTSLCQNQLFYKSLDMLMKYQPQLLYRENSQIVKQNKKIQQIELNKLFQGLHPLVFHQFQAWGLYVIQFFIRNRWIYVLVDDKIPCDENRKPLFATSLKGTGSFVSLIQKAYAKLKGSYEKIYQSPNLKKYISQLSGLLSYDVNLNNPQSNEDNNKLWSNILSQTNMVTQLQEVEKLKEKKLSYQTLYFVNQSLCDLKARKDEKSGLKVDYPVQIYFSTELKQQNAQNQTYQLMFLNCPYEINQESKWNSRWCADSKNWRQNSGQIKSQINKWDNGNQNFKIYKNGSFNTFIIDYELMNQMFNTLLVTRKIFFQEEDKTIVLRKELQLEKNFSCHYKINSTNQSKKVKLIVLLNKIKAPTDAKILLQLKNENPPKDPANEIKPQTYLMKGDFGCYCFEISTQEKDLQIKVGNFEGQQQYVYQITFYLDHPRYSLKERDRQLLFRFVSVYEERSRLDFDILTEEEKKFFYQNYFPNAGRKGFLCC